MNVGSLRLSFSRYAEPKFNLMEQRQMPIIIRSEETTITRQGEGWTELTLVDVESASAPPMVARRWVLAPNARGPELVQGDTDQLLYVIRGSGQAIVDGQEFALDTESVLWLEPGEQYRFFAAETGLEILQGYARER